MHTHVLQLSLVIGHPFGIFDCAGLQWECVKDGCEYRKLETREEFESRRLERESVFCGSLPAVMRRGCTCGRATEQEIADLRQEADEAALDINRKEE